MAHRTIILKGLPERVEGVVDTSNTIRPGDHVALQSDAVDTYALGGAANVQGNAIAVEDDLQGKTVADSYVATDLIQVAQFLPGMEAAVRAGGTIAKGTAVKPGAAGEFVAATDGESTAVALEAGTANNLMRVRFVVSTYTAPA